MNNRYSFPISQLGWRVSPVTRNHTDQAANRWTANTLRPVIHLEELPQQPANDPPAAAARGHVTTRESTGCASPNLRGNPCRQVHVLLCVDFRRVQPVVSEQSLDRFDPVALADFGRE